MDGCGGFPKSDLCTVLDFIFILDSINHQLGSRKARSLKTKRSKQTAILNPEKRKTKKLIRVKVLLNIVNDISLCA